MRNDGEEKCELAKPFSCVGAGAGGANPWVTHAGCFAHSEWLLLLKLLLLLLPIPPKEEEGDPAWTTGTEAYSHNVESCMVHQLHGTVGMAGCAHRSCF